MTYREEKKPDLQLNYKRVAIIAIILVSIHLWGMFGGYEWISEISPIYRDMKITMTEPSVSDQCWDLLEDEANFKDFLGIGVIVTHEDIDEMSYVDFKYLTELETKIQDLGCSY